MFSYSYKIKFDDVDAASIVYYPRYFHVCHLALEAFFDELGPVTYSELIFDRKLGFPIVHVDGDYKAPLVFGDVVIIDIAIQNVKTSSLTTQYRFRSEHGKEYFIGLVTTVCIDFATKKSTPLPSDLRSFFESHQS